MMFSARHLSCAGCLQAERVAQRATQRLPAGHPTIIVAGRKVAVGKALTEDRIAKIVTTQLRRNHAVASA